MALRKCAKCEEEKDIIAFYKNKNYPDGLYPHCKTCHYHITRTYKQEIRKGRPKKRDIDYSKITEQTCNHCNQTKPLSDFPKDKNRRLGVRGTCRICNNDIQNQRYRDTNGTRRKYLVENREDRLKMYRDIKYRKSFGLSLEEVTKMHEERDYRCAICDEKFDWLCVDHNHDTGAVRDLLCTNCNSGIGMLKDNANLVLKAFEYLTKHKSEVKTHVN